MTKGIKKTELTTTPTTSLESAASNISYDDNCINIIDLKENNGDQKVQKNNKISHFDEDSDSDDDIDDDDLFPVYESRIQRLYHKVSDNISFVRNTANGLVNDCYKTVCRKDMNVETKCNNNDDDATDGDITFDKFFERRTKAKEALYLNVFVSGFIIASIGSIVNGSSVSSPESSITYALESIVGSFARVFGFCMMSVIPVNEFDVIEKMVNPKYYYLRIIVFTGALIFIQVVTASDFEFMKNPHCRTGVLVDNIFSSILCISVFKPKITYRFLPFICSSLFCFLCLGISFVDLDAYSQSNDIFAFYAVLVWLLNSCLVAMVGVSDWSKRRYEFSLNFRLSPDKNDIFRDIDEKEHWGATSSYKCIYITFSLNMVVMFLRATGYMYRDEQLVALYWFLAGVADVLPMVAVLIFGTTKCFSLLARYYEYSIETLQSDGACLSTLVCKHIETLQKDVSPSVSSCTDAATHSRVSGDSSSVSSHVVWTCLSPLVSTDGAASHSRVSGDDSGVSSRLVWILREDKSGKYSQLVGDKDGSKVSKAWIKGTTISKTNEMIEDSDATVKYEYIKVRYADDIGCYYFFEGSELKEFRVSDLVCSSENNSEAAFEEWKNNNFKGKEIVESKFEAVSSSDIVESNFEEKVKASYVVIRQEKKADVTSSKEQDLILWANTNLRKLEWGKHSIGLLKSLLRQSPREIGSELLCTECKEKCQICIATEKERLYNLSTPVPRIKFEWDKIDYFVSHSWDDDYEQKWKALRKFGKDFFKKNKRYPTFWLDKVCIDQRHANKSLSVLPINIASTKKMLVLMSDTYLNRLWCIWELFTLFSFCSKELAIERLEIIYLKPSNSAISRDELMDEQKMINKIKKLASTSSPIESSHCFGPEEEYKLRNIMHKIGLKKLKEAFDQIAKALEEKSKKSFYDIAIEKLSSIVSSRKYSRVNMH